jgi:hypothetical protein
MGAGRITAGRAHRTSLQAKFTRTRAVGRLPSTSLFERRLPLQIRAIYPTSSRSTATHSATHLRCRGSLVWHGEVSANYPASCRVRRLSKCALFSPCASYRKGGGVRCWACGPRRMGQCSKARTTYTAMLIRCPTLSCHVLWTRVEESAAAAWAQASKA